MKNKIFNTVYESGQILLILVMIMAIAITIVLTITFTTRTDTQLTKLEEDSQKALAAAEAGIESSLKSNSAIGNLAAMGGLGTNIATGSTTLTTTGSSSPFTSPKIISGEAYTVYLATYNSAVSPASWGSSNNLDVTICFGDSSSRPALDIALLKSASVLRFLADPGIPAQLGGGNKLSVTNNPTGACSGYAYLVTIPQASILADSRLLVIRSMFASTKLLVIQSGLPVQGRTVTSQATTTTGVTKKVQLFQSYPQIPAEFFFTTF